MATNKKQKSTKKSTKAPTKKYSKSNKKRKQAFSLKKILVTAIILIALGFGIFFLVKSFRPADYIVESSSFFAPFEYYEGRTIKGVDVDIVNAVAKKMGKKIEIKDVEFDMIIDNVEKGKIADAGAAGLTITEARKEKVDFSIPYYTSIQYIIFNKETPPTDRKEYVLWDELAGGVLGSQTGSTGYLFASDEVEDGALKYKGSAVKGFDSHQLAADAISAKIIDFAVVDELPAKMIVEKNSGLDLLPLYYRGENGEPDYPTEESYAIAVNKNRPELLEAFNEVLTEMLEKDSSGQSEIDRLVLKHMGF